MNTCITCDKKFEGRANKRFCSISCKNKYHNKKNREKEAVVHEINKILHKNWVTLHQLYDIYRSSPISMDVAEAYGFNKNYFTHIHNSPFGEKYTMIYDLGLKSHIDNKIQIIKI
ncbi:MAG: hypothetical protein WDZ35_09215 [Crocinitomicaceae bacterium]